MENWSTSYGQYPELDWGGETRLLEPIQELLASGDGRTRSPAAKVLGWIGEAEAVDALASVLANDDAPALRERAAEAVRLVDDDLNTLAGERLTVGTDDDVEYALRKASDAFEE